MTAAREYARLPDFPIRYETCWAALVRDEVQNKVAFDNAVYALATTPTLYDDLGGKGLLNLL